MSKVKGASRSKEGNFLKWGIAKVLKLKYRYFYFALLIIGALLSVYVLVNEGLVEVEWDGPLPKIGFKQKATSLKREIQDEKNQAEAYGRLQKKYEKLEKDFREYRKSSVEISRLSQDLQGTPDEVVAKITTFWQERESHSKSIWYCCYVISSEIADRVSIDTKRPVKDEDERQVYRCIQYCLDVLGYYRGEIDGDQGRTYDTVLRFQVDKGLEADGKVGRQTWIAILRAITQKIHGKGPAGSRYPRLTQAVANVWPPK